MFHSNLLQIPILSQYHGSNHSSDPDMHCSLSLRCLLYPDMLHQYTGCMSDRLHTLLSSPLTPSLSSQSNCMRLRCLPLSLIHQHYSKCLSRCQPSFRNTHYIPSLSYCQSSQSNHCPQSDTHHMSHHFHSHCNNHPHTQSRSHCLHCHSSCNPPLLSTCLTPFPMHCYSSLSSSNTHHNSYSDASVLYNYYNSSTQSHLHNSMNCLSMPDTPSHLSLCYLHNTHCLQSMLLPMSLCCYT